MTQKPDNPPKYEYRVTKRHGVSGYELVRRMPHASRGLRCWHNVAYFESRGEAVAARKLATEKQSKESRHDD